MPEVYRESRYTRERDSSPSDDERRTTVRRYKVTPSRVEREVDVIEEDRRSSRYGGRSSQADLLEVDRRVDRVYIPERPRSAIDPSPRSATYTERQVIEREREPRDRDEHYTRVDRVEYVDDRGRGGVVERERERVVERDDWDYPERQRTVVERQVVERERDDDYYIDRDRGRVVYEKSKEIERIDRDGHYTPRSPHGNWEHRHYYDDDKDTEVRIDKRVERRDDGTEVFVERRVEERRDDSRGSEVEHYRKETEYYEPAQVPVPIVIRPRVQEQKIIVQEAPPPAPVVIREQAESREIVAGRRPERDAEYYYHRESREVGPYRDDRREEEYAMARYDEEPRRHHHHHRRRDSAGSEDAAGYYKKTVVRRDSSGSPHRKRHIAEGALAGAGLSALLSSRRNADGELPEHRGRKVVAGAALGALGTEVVRRAHSAYQERYGEQDERGRSRSRSRSRPGHSRIKTGLGIAAVALAAAGAAKYYQSNKIEKEEMSRGRSRHRYSDSDMSRSPSRKRSRSRAASIAKVGLGTAAAAGLIQHLRSKSKPRDGKSRSRSRVKTAAGIAAAGLVGAGAKKLYDRQQDKKLAREDQRRERELSESESEYERDARDYRRRDRSRSRSRSMTRSAAKYPDDSSIADPELGMVEYGTRPINAPYDPPYASRGAEYDSAAEEGRSRRRRKSGYHGRARSRGVEDYSADSEADSEREKKPEKKRSASRLRDLAAGGVAAAAAAVGIKKYSDNKKEKEKEKEREGKNRDRERDRERDRDKDRDRDRDMDRDRYRDPDQDRHRERERERRRYEDESTTDDYDDYYRHRTPSPPTASGGFYSAPPPPNTGFTQHPNYASTNLNQGYVPYNPNAPYDPAVYPPPGPPPNSAASATGMHPPPPAGPEHVSEASRGPFTPETDEALRAEGKGVKDGVNSPASHPPRQSTLALSDTEIEDNTHPAAKSVAFIPLSPQSSRTLRRHHEESAKTSPVIKDEPDTEDSDRGTESNRDDAQIVPYRSSRTDESPKRARRRRDTDPSSDRPLISRRSRARQNGRYSDSDSEEDVIEVLPDRFDSQGRPLDSRGHSVPRMHSRRGDFEYRSPRGPDGLQMLGQWGVMGTDGEAVERIVKNVTGVLEGKGSWLGLLGGLLSGSLLKGTGGDSGQRRIGGRGAVSDDEEYNRKEGRRRGKERDDGDGRHKRRTGDEKGQSSRGGRNEERRRRRNGGDDYYDDDSDDSDNGWRKRRRDVRRAKTWDVSGREGEGERNRERERGKRRDWNHD